MGLKLSSKKRAKRSDLVDQQLQKDLIQENQTIKIIVLGTGDSGKSTLLKQMRIVFQGGLPENDKKLYKDTIRANIIRDMVSLLKAAEDLEISLNESNKSLAKYFYSSVTPDSESLNQELAFQNRSKFQIPDQLIFINNYTWRVVDVGGQRSERRKWIHHFDDVDVFIYIVAISEYDQQLFEDSAINRMHESMSLFNKTANSENFKEKNCILFFNKTDLFQKKLKTSPLSKFFPDFNFENDPQSGHEFFKQKFLSIGRNHNRHIFTHFTCAIDTDSMKLVLEAVNVTIIENHLKKDGFI
ncbi:g protein alpha i subunit [Anaeramoeba ignava]|uniref:G protein alpha i subunit n=1 Tax=Anaeramoeba ignava TaxID=1746090 RepID=A0A9Q0LZS2_ANAIG|nr:g protein alpha i subunit [Anaeramoeba ignava]